MEVTAIGNRDSIIVGEAHRMSQKCPSKRHWLGVAYRGVSVPYINNQSLWPSGSQRKQKKVESQGQPRKWASASAR